jgi:hypothetical protein
MTDLERNSTVFPQSDKTPLPTGIADFSSLLIEESPLQEEIIERNFGGEEQPNQEQLDIDVPEFTPKPEASPQEPFNAKLGEISAKTLVGLGEKFLPKIAHHFSKIDEGKIAAFPLAEGTMERVRALNQSNLKLLQEEVEDTMPLLEAPLKEVMKAKQWNVSPEFMLAMVGVFVLGGLALKTMEIRTQNALFLSEIRKSIEEKDKKEQDKPKKADKEPEKQPEKEK